MNAADHFPTPIAAWFGISLSGALFGLLHELSTDPLNLNLGILAIGFGFGFILATVYGLIVVMSFEAAAWILLIHKMPKPIFALQGAIAGLLAGQIIFGRNSDAFMAAIAGLAGAAIATSLTTNKYGSCFRADRSQKTLSLSGLLTRITAVATLLAVWVPTCNQFFSDNFVFSPR